MRLNIRFIQSTLYVPNVTSSQDLNRAFGPLKRKLKEENNIAMAIEPFQEVDRGSVAITVIGFDSQTVEQESNRLIEWIEKNIEGQTLEIDVEWL